MSELNQYLAAVAITDAFMHDASSTQKDEITVSVLAASEEDVHQLVVDFFSRAGTSLTTVNGVPTLYRKNGPTGPGAIRQVAVTDIRLFTDHTQEPVVEESIPGPTPAEKRAATRAAKAAALALEAETKPAEEVPVVEAPVVEPVAEPVVEVINAEV